MNRTADVIIIGAGIIGCGTAFELAKKGYKTLNIDKLPEAGYGSTSNSCALTRFFYSTWEGVAMSYEGLFYWKDWPNYLGVEDERGLAYYTERGTIMLMTEGHDHAGVVRLYDEIGVKYEVWDVDTLKQKMPLFDVHAFWPPRPIDDPTFWDDPEQRLGGAVFTPQSGYMNDPQLATHNLFRAAQAKGGQFLFNNEVVEIRRENGRFGKLNAGRTQGITLKSGEKIDAPVVVNVAGPHSFVINRMAGVEAGMKIKTRALRHEVHHVPAPPNFNYEQNGHPVSDGDAGTYFRPQTGNKIAVGTEDPECDPREYVEDPDSFVYQVSADQFKRQVYRLARRLPDLPIPNQPQGVADMYDVSDDWIPIYDKSDLPGFYMAVGTSGNQFKNAGIAGLMMAELIEACENGRDHDNDPVKITGPYTGLTLNAGFYSRLRDVNPDSTFTVRG